MSKYEISKNYRHFMTVAAAVLGSFGSYHTPADAAFCLVEAETETPRFTPGESYVIAELVYELIGSRIKCDGEPDKVHQCLFDTISAYKPILYAKDVEENYLRVSYDTRIPYVIRIAGNYDSCLDAAEYTDIE